LKKTNNHGIARQTQAGLATACETAAVLGIAEKTVRKWIAERRLPVIRLGRSVRIRWTDIARIVDQGLAAVEGRAQSAPRTRQ
jgi:excisionase family DNA binding protein